MVIACLFLGDAVLQQVFKIPTMFDNHTSLLFISVIVGVLDYLIAVVEYIVSFRDDNRGKLIPLIILCLPGGVIVRSVFMLIVELLVVLFKLAIYFISVMFEFVVQILHVDKFIGTSSLVDGCDLIIEPMEYFVNSLYNKLFFCKIRTNSNAFTALFNHSLSFWCINH